MQIFNMLSGIQPSGSAPVETELTINTGQPWSQEDLSTFLAHLELAFSQSGQAVEGELPWANIQLSEEGELLDQSGNPLPFMQLINGQSLPLSMTTPTHEQAIASATTGQPVSQTAQPLLPENTIQRLLSGNPAQQLPPENTIQPPPTATAQQLLPETITQQQIKLALLGEQAKSAPQVNAQATPYLPQQLSSEKAQFLSNIQAMYISGSKESISPVIPELPTVAVTALDRAGLASHLPSSLSALQQVVTPTTQSALTQLPTIGVPVGEKTWGENLSQRIQWMVKQEIQGAEIKLNPRGLGPIEIRVSMQNEQTNVSFVAHHALTREALEAAIPRLREMFNDSNMNLSNVDVSDQNSSKSNNMTQSNTEDGNNNDEEGAMAHFGESEVSESAGVRLASNGMLDDYA